MEIKVSTKKFKELVHFIVHSCQDSPKMLGSIRLNKALWFADVYAYKTTGDSITGESYVRRERGPVPKRILATLKQLEKEDKIQIVEPKDKFDAREYISLTVPKANHLSDSERDIAKSALDSVWGRTTKDVSDKSHDIAWEAAEDGEEIPFYTTLVSEKGEITDEVRNWAAKIISNIPAESVRA